MSTEYLIKKFWEIHDPTQINRQGNDIGNNYRSALYWTTLEQKETALQTKTLFQSLLTANGYGKIITEIKPLDKFWIAEDYHQDYLQKNSTGYCPNHSTGVVFATSDTKTIKQNIITPLTGMEIIILNTQEKDSCLYCLQFEKETTSQYEGSIPIRIAHKSALKGFDFKTITYNTTLIIFFIQGGKEIWSHQGYMTSKEFYQALGEFKLGKESETFNVAFNQGTDNRFCKQYDIFKNTPNGVFIDKLSGKPLFNTKDRFNSKSGWLSFSKPVADSVYEKADNSYSMNRIEVRSKSSDIHLGHVFNDGPNNKPRYCINATVLEFVPKHEI